MEKESKRSEPEGRDRLSELHDSLIFSIFEFLPMKYVVRTQILSHRWKNLWTLTPYLHFENEDRTNIAFRNFVNQVILFWRGDVIKKCKFSGNFHKSIVVDVSDDDDGDDDDDDSGNALFTDLDLWLRFAVDNGVEELDLSSNVYYSAFFNNYCLPQFLYSCSSLKNLSLSGLNIKITEKAVQWKQLLNLTIRRFEVTASAVNQILDGSPLLEVFNLFIEESHDNVKLNLRSSSLKELSICKDLGDWGDISQLAEDTELRIWAPKLKSLRIGGLAYGKCLLKNVSSLSHASLWFDGAYGYDDYDEDDHGFSISAVEYVADMLSQILPALWRVERLTLSDWSMKVIGDMNNECMLSPMSNVKLLTLYGCFGVHARILCLLEVFPKLETLVVKDDRLVLAKGKGKFKLRSRYFLKELRTVEVTWNQEDFSIFPLLESLLKYASSLEKMVFRVKEITQPSTSKISNPLFVASQKLLRMRRSSPAAQLVFCE